MKYTDNTQFIEYIKSLVGKQILFKLTDDKDEEGLTGILKQFNDNLIIERDGLEFVIELYELYYIEEYEWYKVAQMSQNIFWWTTHCFKL